MKFYLIGVLIGAMFWVLHTALLFAQRKSIRERNLNRIGLRSSWVGAELRPLHAWDLTQPRIVYVGKTLLIVLSELPLILGSWFYVIFVVGTHVYRHLLDIGTPAVVRDYRWKLRNLDMTFDRSLRWCA
jgi:hypothetical protein